MRLAVLDDYQGVALELVDWSRAQGVSVVPFRDHVECPEQLVARLADFDAVMRIRERTAFTASTLERLPRLKLILATGMRNARSIDLAAADALGITVCTTDAQHQSTVEIVWALILCLSRQVLSEAQSLRAGSWQSGLGVGLAGRTIGIVGLGNMGQPVARIAREFGMRVIAWSPNLTQERADPFGVACVSKKQLFQESDVITIHMPMTSATVGIVTSEDIASMRPDAFLVNTSRPRLIDQDALLDALIHGRIAGAGLDVFEVEPLPPNHPYRTLANVLATPHIGFVTAQNYRIFYEESLENLVAYRAGSPIRRITAANPFLPDSQVALQNSARP
jgi:phosphoglycerate dehydrogenase-like enzyme